MKGLKDRKVGMEWNGGHIIIMMMIFGHDEKKTKMGKGMKGFDFRFPP